jgi:hypothetical protein
MNPELLVQITGREPLRPVADDAARRLHAALNTLARLPAVS